MLHTARRQLTLSALVFSVLIVLPVSAQTINEDIKLTASDGSGLDFFGFTVGISGTTAIVGALGNDDVGGGLFSDSGSAYIFDLATGQELFKLTASDAAETDQFGHSVAISGTTAIVGANLDDDAGSASGSAYLFDTITGQELFKLTPSDAAAFDEFGNSVAIFGSIAIVGAPHDNSSQLISGSAYVFDTTTGQQLFKLTASDAAAGDLFGHSVAISGTTAIVGEPNSRSAYLFDTTTGQQLFMLKASGAMEDDQFGLSVAISGTTAIVGARDDDDAGTNSGSAYLFDTTTGQQLFKLTASDAVEGDQFGLSVAISGATAIVGAWQGNSPGGSDSGSAYVFDTTTGQQLFKFIASDAAAGDQFGSSVAIFGTTAIVGSHFDNFSSGSAYLFTTATPCPADLTGDGELNFFDVSAFLQGFGNQDSVADFTGDGEWNFFDVSAFLTAFSAGCP